MSPSDSLGCIGERTRQPLLVSYDIADNRRRYHLRRLLMGYGEPLQKSVFICWVDAGTCRRLQSDIERFAMAGHAGVERIDMLPLRPGALPAPGGDWIVE